MGLSRALAELHADRTLHGVVRDVLLLYRDHPLESFTAAEIARRTGRPQSLVEPLLLTLARCFVLDFHSDPPSFGYKPDAMLKIDVDEYLRRVGSVQGQLQDNVARFRARHDHF